MEKIQTKDLMDALHIHHNQRSFTLRDNSGKPYDGPPVLLALAALSRRCFTPELSADVHRIACAIIRSISLHRIPDVDVERIQHYKISHVCDLVVRVHEECYDMTIQKISDEWLVAHAREL